MSESGGELGAGTCCRGVLNSILLNAQVSGEPVMSENDPTVGVQQGDIARGKLDREVGCFGDYSGGGTIEQTEDD